MRVGGVSVVGQVKAKERVFQETKPTVCTVAECSILDWYRIGSSDKSD